MKVIGKFMGGYNSRNFAVGGYAAFDVEWSSVQTYTGASVEEDQRCFVQLGTPFLITHIKTIDGDYLTPEAANSLVKNILSKKVLDLDEYRMGFFGIWDLHPDGMYVRNELDFDYSPIPLEVKIV